MEGRPFLGGRKVGRRLAKKTHSSGRQVLRDLGRPGRHRGGLLRALPAHDAVADGRAPQGQRRRPRHEAGLRHGPLPGATAKSIGKGDFWVVPDFGTAPFRPEQAKPSKNPRFEGKTYTN